MYYEKNIKKIIVRLLSSQKQKQQKYLEIDTELQHDQINLTTLLIDFVNRQLIPPQSQVFYLDPFQKFYIFVGDFINQIIKRPFSLLLSENCLCLLYKKHTISDQALANPIKKQKKRPKQRSIKQVIQYCKQWRRQYRQGRLNEKGEIVKVTLDESANNIGISRKTLQDYYLQLKNGIKLEFDFYKYKDDKVGILRNFVRQNLKKNGSQIQNKMSKNEQELTFNYIQNCLKQKQEQRLFYFQQELSQYIRYPIPRLSKNQKMKNQQSSSSDQPYLFDQQ